MEGLWGMTVKNATDELAGAGVLYVDAPDRFWVTIEVGDHPGVTATLELRRLA